MGMMMVSNVDMVTRARIVVHLICRRAVGLAL